jgi:hypothetical protein
MNLIDFWILIKRDRKTLENPDSLILCLFVCLFGFLSKQMFFWFLKQTNGLKMSLLSWLVIYLYNLFCAKNNFAIQYKENLNYAADGIHRRHCLQM